MKGQVSTELLVIVGLILLIFIPLLIMVYVKANDANQQMATYQAELTVTRIASLANSVGSLGTETSIITDVYLPPNMIELKSVSSGRGGEIVLVLGGPEGESHMADVVKYPLDKEGTILDSTYAGGRVRLNISSVGDDAKIKIEQAYR